MVLWTPEYVHILVISKLLDRNSECTIKTEDGTFESATTEDLLYDNSSPLVVITHRIKQYTYLPKLAKYFLRASPRAQQLESHKLILGLLLKGYIIKLKNYHVFVLFSTTFYSNNLLLQV